MTPILKLPRGRIVGFGSLRGRDCFLKVLPPEGRGVYAVAKETGISAITIQSWLAKLNDGTFSFDQEGTEPTQGERGAAVKLKMLLEAQKIGDTEKDEWLPE